MSDASELPVASAALAIAVFAAVIAISQASLQYFQTGHLIRLCDSVVFGLLPGQGRRIWEWSQFRFRIVYDLPLFGIDPDLWPASAAPTFTGAEAGKRAIRAEQRKTLGWRLATRSCKGEEDDKDGRRALAKPYVGEASWASFCRTIHPSCYDSLLFWFIKGDADRCPSDLPTVPMPVSLRDTAVMALMTGMECTAADFDRGSISMRGEAGTITSATHPILGPILHYTPPLKVTDHFIAHTARIYKDWLWRAMDNCVVAGAHFNVRSRMDVQFQIEKSSQHEWRYKADLRHAARRPRPVRLEISESGPGTDEDDAESALPSTQSSSQAQFKRDGAWHFVPRPPSGIIYPDVLRGPHVLPDFSAMKALVPRHHIPVVSRPRPEEKRPDPLVSEWMKARPPPRTRQLPSDGPDISDAMVEDDVGSEDNSKSLSVIEIERQLEMLRAQYEAERESRMRSGRDDKAGSTNSRAPQEDEHESGTSRPGQGDIPGSAKSRSVQESEKETVRSRSMREDKRESSRTRSGQEDGPHTSESRSRDSEQSGEESGPEHEDDDEVEESHAESEEESRPSWDTELGERLYSPRTSKLRTLEREAETRMRKRQDEQRILFDWRREQETIQRRSMNEPLGQVTWFWLSQTDIIPGYWATPWKCFVSLSFPVCVGAIHVLIEAIVRKLGPEGIDFEPYLGSNPRHALTGTIEWMRQGKPTYPAYAYKADGGVVCAGGFAPYEPSTVRALFNSRIPAVSLLDSYTYQIDNVEKKSKTHCERRLVELMRLDAWLSIVGRTREIVSGRSRLHENTPAVVQELIDRFGSDFVNLYASNKDRGLDRQMNGLLAREVVQFLEDRCGSGGEALYAVVAALRTVKVGICVLTGADTSILGEIFEKDVLVYLV